MAQGKIPARAKNRFVLFVLSRRLSTSLSPRELLGQKNVFVHRATACSGCLASELTHFHDGAVPTSTRRPGSAPPTLKRGTRVRSECRRPLRPSARTVSTRRATEAYRPESQAGAHAGLCRLGGPRTGHTGVRRPGRLLCRASSRHYKCGSAVVDPCFTCPRRLRNFHSHAPCTELYGSRRRFLPALFFA